MDSFRKPNQKFHCRLLSSVAKFTILPKQRGRACTASWAHEAPLIIVLLASPCMVKSVISPALAADWELLPKLAVREIYTDNIRLAPDNEKWELVTEINPGLDVRGQGRRIDLSLSYNLQALLFPSGDFDDEMNHRFQATGTGELIEQLVFLDVDGAISQTNADNTARQAADNIAQTGNIIDTYVYRISPYLVNRFSNFAQSTVRYAFGEVINEGNTVDSELRQLTFQVDSGSLFSRLSWQSFGETRDVKFDDGTETKFRQAGVDLRYQVFRKLRMFGGGGYEFQDFGTNREDEKGVFWQTGASWTPSSRTKFEGGYGKRFFGKNWFFRLNHQTRRATWRASFTEDVKTTSDVKLDNQVISGTQIDIPTNQATPTSEVIVSKRFDGSTELSGRRTNISLIGFYEDRDFQESGDRETVVGVSLFVIRDVSRATTIQIGGKWEETKFRDGIREDERREASVKLNRRIGRDFEGSLEYRHTNLSSNAALNEFQENRITAALSVTF